MKVGFLFIAVLNTLKCIHRASNLFFQYRKLNLKLCLPRNDSSSGEPQFWLVEWFTYQRHLFVNLAGTFCGRRYKLSSQASTSLSCIEVHSIAINFFVYHSIGEVLVYISCEFGPTKFAVILKKKKDLLKKKICLPRDSNRITLDDSTTL